MLLCAGGIWDTKHLAKLHTDLIPNNSLGGAFERVSQDVSFPSAVQHVTGAAWQPLDVRLAPGCERYEGEDFAHEAGCVVHARMMLCERSGAIVRLAYLAVTVLPGTSCKGSCLENTLLLARGSQAAACCRFDAYMTAVLFAQQTRLEETLAAQRLTGFRQIAAAGDAPSAVGAAPQCASLMTSSFRCSAVPLRAF